MKNISGKTQVTGIFGYPIGHTLSPAMQNAAFEAMSLDYCYVPFLVQPDALQNAVNAIRALRLRGVNITVPHKEKIMDFLDDVHVEARFIGAVNTIVNNDGSLIGFNTDGRGFMKSLAEAGISIRDKNILIVGAGGAARAVAYYLCKEAHSLTISARTHERAETLARDLRKIRDVVQTSRTLPEMEEFHIIVNATPLGLKSADPLPFQTMGLHKGQVVYDLIYRDTPLLEISRTKGCTVLNGAGMLLWQGALAFELWTGKEPPVEAMRTVLMRAIP